MAYSALVLRPNVGTDTTVHRLIAKGICWHFDAWLFRDADNNLYLDVQTRRGGRDALMRNVYHYAGGSLRAVADVPATARAITLQDRGELANYAELNALHCRYVVPMIARRPIGFRSQSVLLHYCRAPSLDPMESATNFFTYARKDS